MAPSERNDATPAPHDAALPYTAAAALGLAVASLAALPASFRLGLPAVLMAAALGRALVAHVRRERLRSQADVWLAEIRSPSPSVFGWRVEELVGERKVVGRTLRSLAEEVRRPRRPGAPNVNRQRLRAESELLFEVAQALLDPARDASPRAVVRSRLLITDCGSPLNRSTRQNELQHALEEILADISGPWVAAEHRDRESPRPGDEAPRF